MGLQKFKQDTADVSGGGERRRDEGSDCDRGGQSTTGDEHGTADADPFFGEADEWDGGRAGEETDEDDGSGG